MTVPVWYDKQQWKERTKQLFCRSADTFKVKIDDVNIFSIPMCIIISYYKSTTVLIYHKIFVERAIEHYLERKKIKLWDKFSQGTGTRCVRMVR
jgi:hypothetical protein